MSYFVQYKSPKHNGSIFIVNDKEKQGIRTFKKLETANVLTILLEKLLKQ